MACSINYFLSSLVLRAKSFTLQPLYNRIKAFVEDVDRPCLLLIDDLNALLSLGIPVQDISDFMQYCFSLMCYSSKVVCSCQWVSITWCDGTNYNPVQKELRHCVYFTFFFILGHLCFLFPLPTISMLSQPQNLLENLAYSTLKRGRGKSTGFNAISLKTRNESEIVANFGWASQPFCTGL